ncbi:MAG: hypothetical protein O2U61_03650 [Candidatus Bathyarchaeota archaeon]|nr:hypothetical protein [Candidatus Bathyarchaeota archaeon]
MCFLVASIKKGDKKRAHSEFYGKYAVVVFRCLRKPVFLKFVNWVLKREEIQEEKVKSVQIRMFPSVKNNGNSLIGRCNPQGEVFLYPKRLDVCRKKFQKMNPAGFRKYVEGRARASLIHELLHLKYESDENKVKQLTKKYFTIFHRTQNNQVLQNTKI